MSISLNVNISAATHTALEEMCVYDLTLEQLIEAIVWDYKWLFDRSVVGNKTILLVEKDKPDCSIRLGATR